MVGVALMYVPGFSIGSVLFDKFTLPAWITALLGVIVFIAVLFMKEPPPIIQDPNELSIMQSPQKMKDAASYIFSFFILLLVFWVYFAQLIPIYSIEFGQGTHDIYNSYTPVGIGFFAARLFIKPLLKRIDEFYLMLSGPIFMAASFLLFVQYSSSAPIWKYWVGTIMMCFGFSIASSLMPSFFSKVVGMTPHLGKFLSLWTDVGSVARFLGPFLSNFFFSIRPQHGMEHGKCCQLHPYMDFSCCRINGVNIVMPICSALMILLLTYSVLILRKVNQRIEQVYIKM